MRGYAMIIFAAAISAAAPAGVFAQAHSRQRSIHIGPAVVVIHHLIDRHQLHDDVQCHGSELSKQLSGAWRCR